MTVVVTKDGASIPIDREVFETLMGNSVANTYRDYDLALDSGRIPFSKLVLLARVAQIPYSLFFAPLEVAKSQRQANEKKLLQGIGKETFSVNTREEVSLADIDLILKDLTRKQQFVKRHDPSLTTNPIVGILRRRRSVADDANTLEDALGISSRTIQDAPNKGAALNLIIAKLESQQILVSQSAKNYMPQQVRVPFSGLTIRDAKVPYIFLNGGDQGDFQEPAGRRIFTLILLGVLIARGIFRPVTYKGIDSAHIQPVHEHEIVGQILMPSDEIANREINSLDDIRDLADSFKVTPSAVIVRLMRLQMLDPELVHTYLRTLEVEFEDRRRREKQSGVRTGGPLSRVNGVRKYNGRELSRRMLHALDDGRISAKDFCRVVCLNNIRSHQIDEFREAIK